MTATGPTAPTSDPPLELLEDILGYLNLSNGNHDRAFADQFNTLCSHLGGVGCWSACRDLLSEALDELSTSAPALAQSGQATAVLGLVFDDLLPRYRSHHADLLFHLSSDDWEHPFLLVRFFEAVLAQGPPWDESDRVLDAALGQLNDFLGYRPVAVLENEQFCEPYPHERHRPMPVYLAGVGAAAGPYQELVTRTIAILAATPADLLTTGHFELDRLDELALDMRAHDHLHPVNKRTTYMFGEWDPHHIDNSGFYRRFLLRQVILDSLTALIEDAAAGGELPWGEAVEDAAIVLAGTVLMASAISGAGPDTHDSTVSLTTLLPVVARLRDAFYEYHMRQAEGERADRLGVLAAETQQPFGHVRQQLNLSLARYGARQIQHRQLALLYARLGYPDAAKAQAAAIPAASIRFECAIQCEVTTAELSAERGELDDALVSLERARDLLTRGIDCGGLPDPWNYLGFQAQFPLFAAREDAIPDGRLEELLLLIDRLFSGYGKALAEAAARGHQDLVDRFDNDFRTLALNWDGYGASIVIDLNAESGVRRWWSASQAARVLATWQSAGSAAGDIGFWAEQVEDFASFQAGPAYAQIVEALLERQDLPAAMGLLMQWLGQAIPTDLAPGPETISGLLERWLAVASDPELALGGPQRARLVERFFAFLEANAETFWQVPGLEAGFVAEGGAAFSAQIGDPGLDADFDATFDEGLEEDDENGLDNGLIDGFEEGFGAEYEEGDGEGDGFGEEFEEGYGNEEDGGEGDDLYAAAYDDVVFRDSTDDGFDAELIDEGFVPGTTEFEGIYRELEPRLRFLESIARLWQQVVEGHAVLGELDAAALATWSSQARAMQEGLLGLLDAIWQHEIPEPTAASDAAIEFDIQLQTKYELLQVVMSVHVQARRAELLLRGLAGREVAGGEEGGAERWLPVVTQAVIHADINTLRRALPRLLRRMARQPLLYVPLDAGGEPRQILATRTRHSDLQFLAEHLPRLGLLREIAHVLRTAHRMERTARPAGAAVTEFDRLFRVALRHVLEAVVDAAADWGPADPVPGRQAARRPAAERRVKRGLRSRTHSRRPRRPDRRRPNAGQRRDERVLELVGRLVERFQVPWLRHSSRTRLAAAEALEPSETWNEVKDFIETYGGELFAAPNLTLGHVRAILHHGTDWFLDSLEREADPLVESRLVEDLSNGTLSRDNTERLLRLIYQTIIDRYHRFVEYNTTTTQSDYGEKIFCLLDFLRLEAIYDRDAWNLAPSEIAHEVLAQGPRPWLATAWESVCAPWAVERAEHHLERLEALERLWGMRLPALADRLGERFLRPLAVNRMRALVEAARADARQGRGPSAAFAALQVEVDRYLAETHGSGIDVPPWLQKLEQAIDRRPVPARHRERTGLTPRAILHQLATWQRPAWPRRRRRRK